MAPVVLANKSPPATTAAAKLLLQLDSPLPTPRRRSCCSSADTHSLPGGTTTSAFGKLRVVVTTGGGQVPFSWESSPGVPKGAVLFPDHDRQSMPPKPALPPGRRQAGLLVEDDEASEKIPLNSAAVTRAPSFIMDRFLPAANAIAATTAKGRQGKRQPLHGVAQRMCSCCERGERHVANPSAMAALADEEGRPARGCGFMVFFPWKPKPIVCCLKSPVRRSTQKVRCQRHETFQDLNEFASKRRERIG